MESDRLDHAKRRAPRRPAGWFGKYRLAHADTAWRPCIVHDVSIGGVGIELPDAALEPGDRVIFDLQVPHRDVAGIVVHGQVRHTRPTSEGGSRAGIEFTGRTPHERLALEALIELQSA